MNCEPVERMREMLHQHFKPNIVERDFSLAISTGRNGARLTHNHARQFQYGTISLPCRVLLSFFHLQSTRLLPLFAIRAMIRHSSIDYI
jgi:Protein of unknown function (DUF2009)